MEMLTALLLTFALIFFLARYAKRRESLDFLAMMLSLLAILGVLMDSSLADDERLVLFFVPFILMVLSAVSLLDQKKW